VVLSLSILGLVWIGLFCSLCKTTYANK